VTAGERLNIFWPCCLLLVCGFAGIAAPHVLPATGERVAVVAPGADAVRIVARAGGYALTTTDTGVIAVSNDPEFVARLYGSGAWLVLRFDGLIGCLDPTKKELVDEGG
jgi:hypothetical protein